MARKTKARPRAYVDTSALIAFLDKSDSHHALFRRLFSDPPALVTTALVLAEGHGWFLKRFDRTRALQFLAFIEELRPLRLVPVRTEEHRGGVLQLRKFSDQDLTLTDAVGLHLMRELHITSCWSTDFHLGLTGVPLIVNDR
ncbi:MAG: type II toxin-antitoxin system VapC family toxin [Deltaproteobacteria bacterium]|nr:type II toxin-antitoxin system VapC family toxin [Deltaproteobacteria bacterium]